MWNKARIIRNLKERTMARLGPDDRPGYKSIDVIEGYNKWAATYDHQLNPLITLEESVTLELIGDVRGQQVLACQAPHVPWISAHSAEMVWAETQPRRQVTRAETPCHQYIRI